MRPGDRLLHFLFQAVIVLIAPISFAQQTGSISGRVTIAGGEPLPGVSIEARSTVLPRARLATTSNSGDYRFPLLPPGNYTLAFSLEGMSRQTRRVHVFLEQESIVSVSQLWKQSLWKSSR